MFARLFADTGLSLDRLRALVEVGAAGSITKAVAGDSTRQSQYSRQLKELEDFFQTKLVERHGKGIRLTAGGKELARISRFFLLGLSNFQRGCLAEEQTFRIGASAAFIQQFLLPVLAVLEPGKTGPRYELEIVDDHEIERRLHELTLDFGIVSAETISRPLQLEPLGSWRLQLWVPKVLCRNTKAVVAALKDQRLPFISVTRELPPNYASPFGKREPRLACPGFLEAKAALEYRTLATLLPDFLAPGTKDLFLCVRLSGLGHKTFQYQLAWNPRLLRLNSHATRRRDLLKTSLIRRLTGLN